MRKNRYRELFVNIIIFIAVFFLSLAFGEVVLRAFTPFPVNDSSNKVADTDLGYRLSLEFHEADANGFRNPPNTGYEIMAIGDSHTYGNNVSSVDSWPAVLRKNTNFSVYNFGVGSYGIFAYHALLKTAAKQETKAAIVALYPRNDFEISFSNCLILEKVSPFWQNESHRLQLVHPAFQSRKPCSRKLRAKKLSTRDWLENNTALMGALVAIFGGKELPDDEIRYEFPNGIQAISVARVNESAENMKPDNQVLRDMLDNFRRMANDWAQSGLKTGVLILPSRERVVYGYFARHNRLDELDPTFVLKMQNQLAVEDRCVEILSAAKIPYYFALNEVVTAFENTLAENRDFYGSGDDGHPLQDGYVAYAQAATHLLKQMAIEK
jgi:hypothetical protein